MTAREKILHLIKLNGPMSSDSLAFELGITKMGARQHLHPMQEDGLIECCTQKTGGRGRPKQEWSLTEKADSHFPDMHRDLSLDMLTGVKDLFGEEGLEKLIEHRSQTQEKAYRSATDAAQDIEGKLKALTVARTGEGYMADHRRSDDGSYFFIENHCPICEAAKACSGLCAKELEIFKNLFSGVAEVDRTEHKIKGARRCAYKLTPLPSALRKVPSE